MKIFISHAVLDKDIAESFIKNVIEECGFPINSTEIFCSSRLMSRIPANENYVEYIRDKLDSSSVVIALISQNYKESEFCLCELGATWVKGTKFIPILIPPIKFDDMKGIMIGKQMLVIDKSNNISSVQDEIAEFFDWKLIQASAERGRKRFNNFITRTLRREVSDKFASIKLLNYDFGKLLKKYSFENLYDFKYDADFDKIINFLISAKYKISKEVNNIINTPWNLSSRLALSANKIFYDNYYCKTTITVDEEKGIFIKKCEYEYIIINENEADNILEHHKVVPIEAKDNIGEYFKILEFKFIDDKGKLHDFTSRCNDFIEINDRTGRVIKDSDDILVTFRYKLCDKKFHKINLVTESVVPINDNIHSFKLLFSCRRFEHIVKIQSKTRWRLQPTVFTPWFINNDMNEISANKVLNCDEESAIIRVENWMLPGSGYSIQINKIS